MKATFASAVLATLVFLGPTVVEAATIFGTDNTNGTGEFTSFDTVTGVETTINPSAPGNVALTFDSADNLFGLQQSGGTLYSIDVGTGVFTTIGSSGVSGLEGLTFDLNGNLLAGGASGGKLYQINAGTGAATLLGDVAGMSDIDGLSVAPVAVAGYAAGTIFAADSGSIYTIDVGTLSATLVASGTGASETLAFAADGTLFVNSGNSYSIFDLATNTSGPSIGGTGKWGSAVQGALSGTPSPVPLPGTLPILGAGVMMLGLMRRRRSNN